MWWWRVMMVLVAQAGSQIRGAQTGVHEGREGEFCYEDVKMWRGAE